MSVVTRSSSTDKKTLRSFVTTLCLGSPKTADLWVGFIIFMLMENSETVKWSKIEAEREQRLTDGKIRTEESLMSYSKLPPWSFSIDLTVSHTVNGTESSSLHQSNHQTVFCFCFLSPPFTGLTHLYLICEKKKNPKHPGPPSKWELFLGGTCFLPISSGRLFLVCWFLGKHLRH